jgi:hypothetical protein
MPRIRRLSSLLLLFLAGFSQAPPPRPSLSDAKAWFAACRSWLDAPGGLQQETAENRPLSEPEGAAGAMPFSAVGVILRLDGRVVGEAWRRGPGTAAVQAALSEAASEARADRRIAALPAELRAELGARLSLELEFAGEPTPLVGDRLDLMATRVEPALEAFAIRNGDRWVFALPSSIQAHNQSEYMNYLALTLARDVGLDPAASKDLKLPDGAAAYRASTRRIAQRAPTAVAFESTRGRGVLPEGAIDSAFVQRMATELADHLAQRWPPLEGLPPETAAALRALGPRALYQPAKNAWPNAVSAPADQALAALALAEFAARSWAPPDARAVARRNAIATIDSLRQVGDGESEPGADTAATAATLLAVDSLDAVDPAWADDAMRRWLKDLRDTLHAAPETRAPPSPTTAAMACAASGERCSQVWRSLAWDPAVPERIVTATPWLAAKGKPLPEGAAEVWSRTLPALMESQFMARVDGASAEDLDGGWPAGGQIPWPNAQSARAALGLASALQRDDLIDADQRAAALKSLRSAMRFIAQLQADDDACHAFRDPLHARGGIRASCWDSEQPMAASAYALLAAVRAADVLAGAASASP